MMRKREFSRLFLIFTFFFSGLLPSISLASSAISKQNDKETYILSSKYYRLTPPKRTVTTIEAIDPRYPNCDYRKVKLCLEQYDHQFYGRLGVNGSQTNVDELSSNDTTGTATGLGRTIAINIPRGALKTSNSSTGTSGAEIALGYLWCDIRAEAELLISTRSEAHATATISPIPIPPPSPINVFPPNPISGPISVKLQTQTYFANLYYDFMVSERIRPFIMCGLGMSVNTLSLSGNSLFNIHTFSKQSYNLAYAGGLGIRIGIFSHCFLTTSYRYMRLGTATTGASPVAVSALGPVNINSPSIQMNNADLYQNTFSVGLMYLF